jgi:hypothetical protein
VDPPADRDAENQVDHEHDNADDDQPIRIRHVDRLADEKLFECSGIRRELRDAGAGISPIVQIVSPGRKSIERAVPASAGPRQGSRDSARPVELAPPA